MPVAITADLVRQLRERSGAPMMQCKKALAETGGDLDKAGDWLRKQGVKTAEKRAGRAVDEGRVSAYIHHNGRVGVLLEVGCETDFVAATDQFQAFCKEISLHIASMAPRWVTRDEVPEDVAAKEKEILGDQVDSNKPPEIRERILEGRLGKFFAENCLLEQTWVKDDKKTIEQYRAETVGVIGENIQIRRFVRFAVGGA